MFTLTGEAMTLLKCLSPLFRLVVHSMYTDIIHCSWLPWCSDSADGSCSVPSTSLSPSLSLSLLSSVCSLVRPLNKYTESIYGKQTAVIDVICVSFYKMNLLNRGHSERMSYTPPTPPPIFLMNWLCAGARPHGSIPWKVKAVLFLLLSLGS